MKTSLTAEKPYIGQLATKQLIIMAEIWKYIPGYEGYYQVSNLGNFRSVDRIIAYKSEGTRLYPGKSLLTETTKDNYQRIVLMKDGCKNDLCVIDW